MLAPTWGLAAEGEMPEVLRYAREYTRDKVNQPEVSLSRKLTRSELIRRQQQARITVLEKQLQNKKRTEDITRLMRELSVAGETVRTLTQKLSQAEQENSRLLTERVQSDVKMKTALDAALAQNRMLSVQQETLAQENKTLRVGRDEARRLTAELVTVRNNVRALEKEKSELKKTLQAMKTRSPEVSLKTDAERQAYAAGVMYARDVREARDGNRMLGINLNTAALHAGLNDALWEQPLRLDAKALAAATESLEKAAVEAFRTVVDREAKLAANWLKTFRKEKGVARDESGFWYRVTYEGDGERLKPEDMVDVVVEEKRADGTVVSDMDRSGSSLRQKVSDFPPVFAAGLTRLKNHGQITLAVPPDLAYGDRGYPPDVPPGAMMIYNIRVSDVITAGR
ncbi:TPA: FKBP-type peptidyl-prolyl cis-trans isomerase N-terminal domain-containing protein [Salmonella enterica subsp. enterica serovar Chester]